MAARTPKTKTPKVGALKSKRLDAGRAGQVRGGAGRRTVVFLVPPKELSTR